MKVGDLVVPSYESSNRVGRVGIVLEKSRPIAKGYDWYYVVYWSNGRRIAQTRGTVEVISEGR